MIDHLGLRVSDRKRSKLFYTQALAPLGYSMLVDEPWGLGFGDHKPDLWLEEGTPHPQHIAFKAKTRAEVDAFYTAAMAAGGRDNGPPGIRTLYHPNYYGAFVLDPDGYNIEAVCHAQE